MPDTKITALTAIGANPIIPSTFPIPMVDLTDTSMAASGTTKKVTVNQILGAGGTATLASATITGDLTVDTSTLKVDSANNRVGIGTASPNTRFVVSGGRTGLFSGDAFSLALGQTTGQANYLYLGTDASGTLLVSESSGNSVMTLSQSGVCTWLDGAGGTRMTLNATGLGVGMSPVSAFNVGATGGNDGDLYFNTLIRNTGTAATSQPRTGILFSGYYIGSTNFSNFAGITGGKENATSGNSAGFISLCTAANGGSPTARLTVDSSGNVGIGVTPTIAKVQTNGAFVTTGAVGSISTTPLANALIGDFNTTTRLISTGPNTTTAGVHKFINASSDASVYLETMTLDALGNVIIRSPATPATLTTNGQLTVNATSDTNLRFSYRGSDGVTRVANITLA